MSAEAWQSVLAAEHAAIYAYGVVGAHVPSTLRPDAVAAETAHRARRDVLTSTLEAVGVSPSPAAPAYTLPFPVRDADGAARLAVWVEEATARVWRAAIGPLDGTARQLAVDGLTECAVRAARWREVAAPGKPPTVAFPGS
jgi:hypothetical protein